MCSLMPDGFLFVISTFSFFPPAERWYFSWATHLSAHDDGLTPGHWHPAISVSSACTASGGAGQPPGNHVHHLFAVPGSYSCFGGSILCFCTALTQGNAAPLHSRKEKGSRSYPHSLPGLKEPLSLVGKVPGTTEAELNGCPASTRASRNLRPRSSTWWAGGFC